MPTSLPLELLRAKLVLACAHTCPAVIHSRVTREQPDALSKPWFSLPPPCQHPARRRVQAEDAHGGARNPVDLTSESLGAGLRDPRLEECHVVMDSRTWTLRELGGEEEARAMANNPSIDAGRGVRLYLVDHMHKALMHGLARMRQRRRVFEEAGLPRKKGVVSNFMAKARAERVVLGLEDGVPDGSSLYYHLVATIEQMRKKEIGTANFARASRDSRADVSVGAWDRTDQDETVMNTTLCQPSSGQPAECSGRAPGSELPSQAFEQREKESDDFVDTDQHGFTGDTVITSADGREEIIRGVDEYAYNTAFAEQLQKEEDDGEIVTDEERDYGAIHERAIEIRRQIATEGRML